ncbi:MAG: hypothetical protein K2O35_00365 [Clostridia bacterium]|nr:hypothetical protein [Clostridia bacterium]
MKRNLILFIAIALLLAMVVTVSVACTPKDDLPKDNQSSGNTSGDNISSGSASSGSTSGDNTSGGSTSGDDRPITEKWEEKFAISYRVDVLTQEELDSLSKEMELDLVYLMQYCDKDDDGRHPIGWISIFGNETDAEEYYDIQVEELEYDSDSEMVVRREGKVVFLGTADGLKIFMEV